MSRLARDILVPIAPASVALILVLLVPCHSGAQDVAASRERLQIYPPSFIYTFTKEGTPKSPPACSVLRGSDGFLWIGTPEGLVRFDGHDTVSYRHPLGEGDEKFANLIEVLYEDRAGNLWLGSYAGLQKFDRNTETLVRYPKGAASEAERVVWDIYEDSRGDFWVGTHGNGLRRFNRDTEEFTSVESDPGQEVVFAIREDRDGYLLAGTRAGLARYDRKTGRLAPYAGKAEGLLPLASDTVTALLEDSHGHLWVGTFRGVTRINPARTSCVHYTPDQVEGKCLPEGRVRSIVEDAFGGIWLGYIQKGMYRYDRETDRFVNYRHREDDPNTPATDNIGRLYAERDEQDPGFRAPIWIPHPEHGVGKLTVMHSPFTYYEGVGDYSGVEPQDWRIAQVVIDDGGAPWLSSFGTWVCRLDPELEAISHFFQGQGAWIVKDCRGVIWATTPKANRLVTYTADASGDRFTPFMEDTVFVVGAGKDSSVWFAVGTIDAHLAKLDPKSGELRHYPRPVGDSQPVKDGGTMTFCEDRNGIIWVGTFGGGMSRLDPATGEWRRFLGRGGDSTSLNNNSVRGILEDESGTLWVGTNGGLHRFDRSHERFTLYPWHVRERDLFIRGMVDDGAGNLWLTGTANHLICFTKATRTFRTYGPERGFHVRASGGIAVDRVRRRIYVGGVNAFVSFDPDSLLLADKPGIPRIAITEFNIFGESAQLPVSITVAREIELPYSDNYISFTFSVLDFVHPLENGHAYRLEGVDRDWVYSYARRYANYTNLDPGEYVFRVKGSNSAGIWNEEGTSVRIVITPPWWRTIWAYIGYGISLVLTLYGIRRYDRKRTLLKHELKMKDFEAEKLREIDGMKMRFFANISHEFRTPLTLILGPVEKLLSRSETTSSRDDLNVVRRNALRLLELINQLLDISRLDAGEMGIRVCRLDLVPYLKGLVFSFASLAERKHISLLFNAAEPSINAYVDRDKLQKIVTNLLSNAFKFTPEGGEVRVGVSIAGGPAVQGGEGGHPESTGGFGEILVSDTGVGMEMERLEKIFHRFYQIDDSHIREHEGTGIGLALTKELVEVHHGHINVSSEPGRGSTFRVRLPLGKEHWKEEEIVDEEEGTGVAEAEAGGGPLTVQEATPSEDELEGDEELEMRDDSEEWEEDSRPLVLIVEDNADVRSYIREFLTREYHVKEAEDGCAGLEAAMDHPPDLVVSDIMMPKMDGVELCRRLKTDERTSHIPVILLTARASGEGKLEGLERGADDYIIKPFDMKELQVRIKNLIELRKTLQEKYRRQCVLEPGDVPIESMEEKFLRRALDVVQEQMSETGFNTATLARGVCMSRMQLNRKLHALTGRSPHEFIRNLRMQRAAKLLEAHWGNVAEVAFEVGFNSLSHFSKAFRKEFGVLPSEYGTKHAQGSRR